ncbi:MAG TPA: hypothetical protein VIF57_01325, partial [Polyangia bacterium]
MAKHHSNLTALNCLGALAVLQIAAIGCGEMQEGDIAPDESALAGDAFTNPNGAARVVTVNGAAIDET